MSAKFLKGQGRGFTVCPNALLEDMRDERTKITATEVAVYLVLNRRVNPNGEQVAWPNIETICADTGLGRVTIIGAVANLKIRGWIEAKRRFGQSTIYTIKYEVDPLPASEPAEDSPQAPQAPQDLQDPQPPVVQILNYSSSDFEPSVVQNLHSNKNSPNKNSKNKNQVLETDNPKTDQPKLDAVTHIFNRATQPATIKQAIIKAKIRDESWRDACLRFVDACQWVTDFNLGKWIGRGGAEIEGFINVYQGDDDLLKAAVNLVTAQVKRFSNPLIYPTAPAGMTKYLLAAKAARTAKNGKSGIDEDSEAETIHEF